ncbi:MAG: GH3 auxin-responsive promoter family protein [Chitinophagales bacterium]
MSLKSSIAKKWAAYTVQKTEKESRQAIVCQQQVLTNLVKTTANKTVFAKDHHFNDIHTYSEFKQAVPLRDYEALNPYIQRVIEGEKDVLWKGKPLYFAKTSGTTSGTKYIPVTQSSIPNHIVSTRTMLLHYIHHTQISETFTSRKMVFLSGSPALTDKNGIKIGRLSGIVNHHIPNYLQKNKIPDYEMNCIEDWEEKLEAIIEEVLQQNMSMVSGIPPWMLMFFERLQQKSGKKAKELFPDFRLMVHGGVNYAPYQAKMEATIGGKIDTLELYAASEGLIAYQNDYREEGLLLTVNSGIFYEFVPTNEIFAENPTRLSIKEVKVGVNYAIIVNNNAGLWGYILGDTVRFISVQPPKLVVTGRVKHFISAFGEHVIGKEIETALKEAVEESDALVNDFTVAPKINTVEETPFHEWYIEFEQLPNDLSVFAAKIDASLVRQNSYYADLIRGRILQPLKIIAVQKGVFKAYQKSIGKLGGQNKLPHLSNDRKLVEALKKFNV